MLIRHRRGVPRLSERLLVPQRFQIPFQLGAIDAVPIRFVSIYKDNRDIHAITVFELGAGLDINHVHHYRIRFAKLLDHRFGVLAQVAARP